MDITKVTAVLHAAIDQNSRSYQAAQEKIAEAPSEVPEEVLERVFIAHAAAPVEEILKEADEFKSETGLVLRNSFIRQGFHAQNSAKLLFGWATKTGNPAEAIARLQELLNTESASGHWVSALWGVTVAEPIKLTADISLLPFESLPDTGTKQSLFDRRDPTPFLLQSLQLGRYPAAALTMNAIIDPLVYDLRDLRSGKRTDGQAQFPDVFGIEDARWALTVVGPCCPLSAGIWFEFDDPDLSAITGYTVSNQHYDVPPSQFVQDKTIDPAEAIKAVSSFVTLSSTTHARISLAIVRLHQAIRRFSSDRALDLTIALEILLIDGAGENTHKVGLRAGLLYPGSVEQKIWARGIVGALYSIRSKLVHTGAAPDSVKVYKQGKRSLYDLIADAHEIVATVIKAVMSRGSIPTAEEWYELELTGGIGVARSNDALQSPETE